MSRLVGNKIRVKPFRKVDLNPLPGKETHIIKHVFNNTEYKLTDFGYVPIVYKLMAVVESIKTKQLKEVELHRRQDR